MINRFIRLLLVGSLFACWSCDRLAGPESREIAAGYRLKQVQGSNYFALIIPHESGGQIIDQIGWRKPLIIARANGSEYWDVINTEHAEHTRVSDETVKSNSAYTSIAVRSAAKAWTELKPDTKIW